MDHAAFATELYELLSSLGDNHKVETAKIFCGSNRFSGKQRLRLLGMKIEVNICPCLYI